MCCRIEAAKDARELVTLEQACFSEPWSERSLAGSLSSGSCLVARAEGLAVGYALFLEGPDCELLRIGVRPEWRRRGIAELLLRERLERVVYLSEDRDVAAKFVQGRQVLPDEKQVYISSQM